MPFSAAEPFPFIIWEEVEEGLTSGAGSLRLSATNVSLGAPVFMEMLRLRRRLLLRAIGFCQFVKFSGSILSSLRRGLRCCGCTIMRRSLFTPIASSDLNVRCPLS